MVMPFDANGNWAGWVGNVRIDLVSPDGTRFFSIATDGSGVYDKIYLPIGGYFFDVSHNGYQTNSSAPGVVGVSTGIDSHADFDLVECSGMTCS